MGTAERENSPRIPLDPRWVAEAQRRIRDAGSIRDGAKTVGASKTPIGAFLTDGVVNLETAQKIADSYNLPPPIALLWDSTQGRIVTTVARLLGALERMPPEAAAPFRAQLDGLAAVLDGLALQAAEPRH